MQTISYAPGESQAGRTEQDGPGLILYHRRQAMTVDIGSI